MTAAGDPLERTLADAWIPTLGDAGAAQGWRELSPLASYRPAETTKVDLPLATLGGLSTLAPTKPDVAQGTLSGARTLADATQGAQKVGAGLELVAEIGRGGMGVVFRARQRSLAREIAVKLVRPDAASDATRSQFVAEALVNGVLDHPNIVPVHELGTTEAGQLYLAMKLVGGTSWKHLLHPANDAQRKLAANCDLDRHLGVLQSVANAVAFAHSKGIVHRDLKPENVMVGEFGEVLVMDWGIAVDVRDDPRGDVRTRHKSTVNAPSGTPSYMPPELAEGRGRDIGPWTDTYLLGSILHELLTGAPPHRGESLLAVLVAASTSKPPRFPAGTPPGLAAICAKALARDPRDRYASVEPFLAALRDYFGHRESEKVAQTAAQALARASSGEARTRTQRYGDFAEAIAGFRQALALWNGNRPASDGEREARTAYAKAALEAGDLGLAEEQVRDLAGAEELRGRIASARAALDAKERAARRNRALLVAAASVIVVGSVAATLWINSAREDAVEAEGRALEAKGRADDARKTAESEKAAADDARKTAENEKAAADEARKTAVAEKARAEEAGRRSREQLVASLHRQAAQSLERGDRANAAVLLAQALEASEATGERDDVRRLALQTALAGLPEVELVYQLDGLPVHATADGRRVVVIDSEHGARVWSGLEGEPLGPWVEFSAFSKAPGGVVASPNGRSVVALGAIDEEGAGMRRLDVETGRFATELADVRAWDSIQGVSDAGVVLALGARTVLARLDEFGEVAGEPLDVSTLGLDATIVKYAALAPDGRRVAAILANESEEFFETAVFDLESSALVCRGPGTSKSSTFERLELRPTRIAWSPDGEWVMTNSTSAAGAWSAATGELAHLGFSKSLRGLEEIRWIDSDRGCAISGDGWLHFPDYWYEKPLRLATEANDTLAIAISAAVGPRAIFVASFEASSLLPVAIEKDEVQRLAPLALGDEVALAAASIDGDVARVLGVGRDGIAKVARYDLAAPWRQRESFGERYLFDDVLAPDGAHLLFVRADDRRQWIGPIEDPGKSRAVDGAVGVRGFSTKLDAVALTHDDGVALHSFPSGERLGPVVPFAELGEIGGRLVFGSFASEALVCVDARSGEALDPATYRASFESRADRDRSSLGGATVAWARGDSVDVVRAGRDDALEFDCGGLVRSFAVSNDGRRLALANEFGVTRVIELETGRDACPPLCEGDPLERRARLYVDHVTFSPAAKLVATAGDSRVRLWEPRDGLLVADLELEGANAAWVTDDGARIVVQLRREGLYLHEDLYLVELSSFDRDLASLQLVLSVVAGRAWNGQTVRKLEWREVLDAAEALRSKGASPFGVKHLAPPKDDWRPRMIRPPQVG